MLSASGCFFFDMPQSPIWDYDFSEMKLLQLEPPHENQPLVRISTSYGDMIIMLFPEEAPNTVENFLARVADGFYDNKPILTLINNEYFLTGALNAEGTQGVTQNGQLIPNEYSVNLWPFKGSLLAFSGRQGYGDSRFFVVGSVPFEGEFADEARKAEKSGGSRLFPDELIQAFEENECIAPLMGGYTIFGQVISGLDVLDKLLSIEINIETKRPLKEFFIEKIVLIDYSEYISEILEEKND
jgi:peptidyl-prolyl cis-trans isomerase B (cyclophilin B)